MANRKSGSRMYGYWDKLKLFTTRIKNVFDRESVRQGLNEIGEEILEQVKEHIYSGVLPLAPLSPAYAIRKQGDTILIETGEWIDNLKVESVEVSDSKLTIFIGGLNESIHNGAVNMVELTEWIEDGTFKQPPRPAFKLTWQNIKYDTMQKIIALLGKEILNLNLEVRTR